MDKARSDEAPVSVVIPCYACAATIERAVASVAGQTWRPKEVIVVDDASPDETRTALESLAMRYSAGWLRVIYRPTNAGPGAARNTGWDVAPQPYVAFLDADDSWHPKKIEIQVSFMLDNPEVDFTATRYGITQKGDPAELGAVEGRVSFHPLKPRSLLWRNTIWSTTVVVRRELSFRFPERRFSEDYELWLRMLLAGARGVLIERTLAYMYKAPYGEGGLSKRLWLMERGELTGFYRLFREGYLPVYDLAWCVPWSLAKFVRRAMIVAVRQVGR